MDNKSGNSNAADRIRVLDFCLHAVGRHRVGLVVGDREFVGQKWFKYLKENGLHFVTRLPKHHLITDARQQNWSVAALGQRPGQNQAWSSCLGDGVWGQAQVTALADGEYLFLFGTVAAPLMGQLYRNRWTIEQCFQNLKGRGFDLQQPFAVPGQTQKNGRTGQFGLCAVREFGRLLSPKSAPYFHKKPQPQKHQFQPLRAEFTPGNDPARPRSAAAMDRPTGRVHAVDFVSKRLFTTN